MTPDREPRYDPDIPASGKAVPSRLIERMKASLDGRIHMLRSGLLGRKTTLDVAPFEAAETAMLRDANDKKFPSGSALGQRLVDHASDRHRSAGFWCEQLRLSARELIEAAKNGQWQKLLIDGWRTTAIRHSAGDWLEALTSDEIEPGETTTGLFSRNGRFSPWQMRIENAR